MTIETYPLQWPAGRPRTPPHKVQYSRFSPGNKTREAHNVQSEILRLGGKNVIISTNVRLRRDGYPYSSDKPPSDSGVAVYFDYLGSQKCFACDRWYLVEENLRAIFKSIEAIRGLDRWGSKSFVEAAFTGFEALPAPKTCWGILEIPAGSSRSEINSAYRRKIAAAHPDHGGSDIEAAEINRARDEALSDTPTPSI